MKKMMLILLAITMLAARKPKSHYRCEGCSHFGLPALLDD